MKVPEERSWKGPDRSALKAGPTTIPRGKARESLAMVPVRLEGSTVRET